MISASELIKKAESRLLAENLVTLEEASYTQLHNAISSAAMEALAPLWRECKQNRLHKRHAYYFSAEYLMGRMVYNNLYCLGLLEDTKKLLAERGVQAAVINCSTVKPLDAQTLDARLLRDFQALSRKQLTAVMDGLVPHNLGQQILLLAKISPQTPVNSVTQAQRAAILQLLKALPLTPKKLRGFEEAIVTRGGVSVREVNPSTMESKLSPGLYFAGELLDLDAHTGGYNLQIAWATGALAGRSAAQEA